MSLSIFVLGASLVALGWLRWREAVRAALILAVFEGALRKWAFPEYDELIYLAKDLLLLGAYAGCFLPRLLRRQRLALYHPATVPLLLFGLLAMLQFANPSLPNTAVGLFGVKAYLGYAPLLYLVPAAFRDTAELRRFLRTFVLLAIVPLTLGVMQFWAPPDEVLNRYAWDEELAPKVALFVEQGRARITGTFSYISGHAVYLTLIVVMGLALVVAEARWQHRLGIVAILAAAVANLFMTGSRGPFLVLGLAVPGVLVLAGFTARRLSLTRVAVLSIMALTALSLGAGLFPDAVGAFRERVEANEDVSDRIMGIVREPIWALGEVRLAGYGIGTTHQATMFLGGEISGPPPAEGEWERIILEVGPIGFLLVIMVRLLVVLRTWRAWRTQREREARAILAAALMFVIVSFPGNLVFNHAAAIFYWFMAGVALISPSSQSVDRAAVSRSVRERACPHL